MKGIPCFLIVCTVVLNSCDSKTEHKVENYYKDGQLQEVYETDDEGLIQGDYVLYFESGIPYKEIEFKDSLKQGKSYTYWPNGVVKAMETYDKNVLIDTAIYYYEDGAQKELFIYDDQGRIRLEKKFYPHGSNKSRTAYHVKSGKVISSKQFHANGTINRDASLYMNIQYTDWSMANFYPSVPGDIKYDSIVIHVLQDHDHLGGAEKRIVRSQRFKEIDKIAFNVLETDYHDGYHVNLLLEIYYMNKGEIKCWQFPIQGNKSYRLPDHNLLPIY